MDSDDFVKDPAALAELAREYDLALVILFGSRATGHTHPESDTDIGVLRRDGLLPSNDFLQLQFRLSQVIASSNVEMVDLRRASGLLKHAAAEGAVVLFESGPGVFSNFRSLAWGIYHDEIYDFRRYDTAYIRRAMEALKQ